MIYKVIPITCEAAPNVKGLKILVNEGDDSWLERSFIEKWYNYISIFDPIEPIHHRERKTHVRSQNPREVVQEVYGWLLGHWAVRLLMFHAATEANVAPLCLSFTGTLRVIRRAIPKFQRLQIDELPLFSVG